MSGRLTSRFALMLALLAMTMGSALNTVHAEGVSFTGSIAAEAKGTIGIVCVDAYGNVIPWYDSERKNTSGTGSFDDCIDDVIRSWERLPNFSTKNGGWGYSGNTGPSDEEVIGGFSTYRKHMDRIRGRLH